MLERSVAMQFCEFRIQLRRRTVVATFSGDLKVDEVPRGPATEPLELQLEGIHKQAVEVLSALVETDRAERDELKLLGCFLYDLLFRGDVRERFEKVYEAVKKADDQVLRVVLDFEDAGPFSELPWEYLYLPDYDQRPRGVFLAAVSTMVLSRHVQLGFDATRATDEIRILGVVSSPRNIKEKVIADPVIDQLEELGRQRGDGEAGQSRACFEVLRQPTRQLFKEKLKSYRPHVLHFAGHGKLERDEGFIGLCLEGTDRVDWLRGSDLPDLLGERRRLRLVVLHACEGAASSGLDGVAHHLVKAAVPAVIAMRYEIDNDAALEFSTTFYEALADGWPVDAAVQRGREAIAQMDREGHYRDRRFGTPVVFLRSEDYSTDHRIIEPMRAAGAAAEVRAPQRVTSGHMPCPFCGQNVNAGGRYCPSDQCNRPFHICPGCGEKAIPTTATRCEDCDSVSPRAAVQGRDLEVVPLDVGRRESAPLVEREPGIAPPDDAGPTARPHELRKRVKPDG